MTLCAIPSAARLSTPLTPAPQSVALEPAQKRHSSAMPSDHFHAIPRFGKTNASAARPGFWDIPSVEMTNTSSASQEEAVPMDMLRHAFLQQTLHPGSKNPLKLLLNTMREPEDVGTFALRDGLSLLEHPMDVVVTSTVMKSGLSALADSRGRSFMTPNASIRLQPPDKSSTSSDQVQKNNDIQTERWLAEQDNQTLTTQICEKSGHTDRKSIMDTLKARFGEKNWSSLQALHMGTKGLIDGILIGPDARVITRQALDTFLKEKQEKQRWTKRDVEQFLQDGFRASEVPSIPFHEAFPKSSEVPAKQSKAPNLFIRKAEANAVDRGGNLPRIPFNLPQHCVVRETAKDISPAYVLTHLQHPQWQSVLGNDAVFFTHDVEQSGINRMLASLKTIDEQRRKTGSQHHISLFLSSLGGDPIYGKMFMDTLSNLRTPVDVIVTGVAISAGSMHLLSGATGKRLATPGAWIMLHEPSASGSSSDVGEDLKREFESTLRFLAQRTGRSVKDLRRDTSKDYWLNPIEALFYGSKGLIDGILVGPNQVITKADVLNYLSKKMGSVETVEKKIRERLEDRRDINEALSQEFDPENPLDNYSKTIREVARQGTRRLGKDPEFLHSGALQHADRIEHTPIKEFTPTKISLKILG